MLAKTFNEIPFLPDAEEEKIELAKIIMTVATKGSILADIIELGKTQITFLWLSHFVLYVSHYISINSHDLSFAFFYRLYVILALFSNVLIQWADLMSSQFKNLNVIIGFGKSA